MAVRFQTEYTDLYDRTVRFDIIDTEHSGGISTFKQAGHDIKQSGEELGKLSVRSTRLNLVLAQGEENVFRAVAGSAPGRFYIEKYRDGTRLYRGEVDPERTKGTDRIGYTQASIAADDLKPLKRLYFTEDQTESGAPIDDDLSALDILRMCAEEASASSLWTAINMYPANGTLSISGDNPLKAFAVNGEAGQTPFTDEGRPMTYFQVLKQVVERFNMRFTWGGEGVYHVRQLSEENRDRDGDQVVDSLRTWKYDYVENIGWLGGDTEKFDNVYDITSEKRSKKQQSEGSRAYRSVKVETQLPPKIQVTRNSDFRETLGGTSRGRPIKYWDLFSGLDSSNSGFMRILGSTSPGIAAAQDLGNIQNAGHVGLDFKFRDNVGDADYSSPADGTQYSDGGVAGRKGFRFQFKVGNHYARRSSYSAPIDVRNEGDDITFGTAALTTPDGAPADGVKVLPKGTWLLFPWAIAIVKEDAFAGEDMKVEVKEREVLPFEQVAEGIPERTNTDPLIRQGQSASFLYFASTSNIVEEQDFNSPLIYLTRRYKLPLNDLSGNEVKGNGRIELHEAQLNGDEEGFKSKTPEENNGVLVKKAKVMLEGVDSVTIATDEGSTGAETLERGPFRIGQAPGRGESEALYVPTEFTPGDKEVLTGVTLGPGGTVFELDQACAVDMLDLSGRPTEVLSLELYTEGTPLYPHTCYRDGNRVYVPVQFEATPDDYRYKLRLREIDLPSITPVFEQEAGESGESGGDSEDFPSGDISIELGDTFTGAQVARFLNQERGLLNIAADVLNFKGQAITSDNFDGVVDPETGEITDTGTEGFVISAGDASQNVEGELVIDNATIRNSLLVGTTLDGDQSITGDLSVGGSTTLDGFLSVGLNATVMGDLSVQGAATLRGVDLDSVTFKNIEFSTAPASNGNLMYDQSTGLALYYDAGTSTPDGYTGYSTLLDSANTTTGQNLLLSGGKAANSRPNLSFADDIDIAGTLGVTGDAALAAALDVQGDTTLSAALDVGGSLDVTGDAGVNSALSVSGKTDLREKVFIGDSTPPSDWPLAVRFSESSAYRPNGNPYIAQFCYTDQNGTGHSLNLGHRDSQDSGILLKAATDTPGGEGLFIGNSTSRPQVKIEKNGDLRLTGSGGIFADEDLFFNNRVLTQGAATGFTGSGTIIGQDEAWFDTVKVRDTLLAFEFEARKITASRGPLAVTPGGGKIESVTPGGGGEYSLDFAESPGIATGDLLIILEINTSGSTRIIMKKTFLRVTAGGNPPDVVLISGPAPAVGDNVVVVGSNANASRENLLYLDPYGPFMDVITGIQAEGDWDNRAPAVRLGDVSGVGDPDLSPAGFGLYGENVFLKGELVVTSGFVKQAFDVGSGIRLAADGFGGAAGAEIRVSADGSGTGTSNFVRTFWENGSNWGMEGAESSSTVFQLGSSNEIAGWEFTQDMLRKTGLGSTGASINIGVLDANIYGMEILRDSTTSDTMMRMEYHGPSDEIRQAFIKNPSTNATGVLLGDMYPPYGSGFGINIRSNGNPIITANETGATIGNLTITNQITVENKLLMGTESEITNIGNDFSLTGTKGLVIEGRDGNGSGDAESPKVIGFQDTSGNDIARLQAFTTTVGGTWNTQLFALQGRIGIESLNKRVRVSAQKNVELRSIDGRGDFLVEEDLLFRAGGLGSGTSGNIEFYFTDNMIMADLPTSDPGVAGSLWVDQNGFIRLSATTS